MALTGHSQNPKLDAEVLLADTLSRSRSYLMTWPEQRPASDRVATFREHLSLRRAGMPVAYIVGTREFWSLPLKVTPATLIPRPETELLVEIALENLAPSRRYAVLDLGTGCGAVAIAIAKERPSCRVLATDVSAAALEVAETNRSKLAVSNVTLRRGDWFEPVREQRFDLIVSNPPYVRAGDPCLTTGDLPSEPETALAAGVDGLDAIRVIAADAGRHLTRAGGLLLEHGYDQRDAVCEVLERSGLGRIECYQDYAGHDRAVLGRVT